mmetsp:Transcript_74477/g.206864  ORF Transcript_74477/g.206864 Transcript_74477/m.206864 type:complete len:395 (+) Transcript_74477:930-2114(+)
MANRFLKVRTSMRSPRCFGSPAQNSSSSSMASSPSLIIAWISEINCTPSKSKRFSSSQVSRNKRVISAFVRKVDAMVVDCTEGWMATESSTATPVAAVSSTSSLVFTAFVARACFASAFSTKMSPRVLFTAEMSLRRSSVSSASRDPTPAPSSSSMSSVGGFTASNSRKSSYMSNTSLYQSLKPLKSSGSSPQTMPRSSTEMASSSKIPSIPSSSRAASKVANFPSSLTLSKISRMSSSEGLSSISSSSDDAIATLLERTVTGAAIHNRGRAICTRSGRGAAPCRRKPRWRGGRLAIHHPVSTKVAVPQATAPQTRKAPGLLHPRGAAVVPTPMSACPLPSARRPPSDLTDGAAARDAVAAVPSVTGARDNMAPQGAFTTRPAAGKGGAEGAPP